MTTEDDRKYMGTPEAAVADLEERLRKYRELTQPAIGTRKELDKRDAEAREVKNRIVQAALLWLWHREDSAAASEAVTLVDCPVGLFVSQSGELCLKTEYGSNEGRIDAYIVGSGELFWGLRTDPKQGAIARLRGQLVRPVQISPIGLVALRAATDGAAQ